MRHAIGALLLLLVPQVLCSSIAQAAKTIRAHIGLPDVHDEVLQQIVHGDSPYAMNMTLDLEVYTPSYLLNRATIVYALSQAEVFASRFALIGDLVRLHDVDPSEVHRGHSALHYMHYWRHAPQLPQLVALFASTAARNMGRCARWTHTASHISKFIAAGRMDAVVALCTAPCHLNVLPAILDTAITPAALPAMNAMVARLSAEESLALMRMPWVRDAIASMLADRTHPELRDQAEEALRLRSSRIARLGQAGVQTDHHSAAEYFEAIVRHVSTSAVLNDDAMLMIDDGLRLEPFLRMISISRMFVAAASGRNSMAVLNRFIVQECVSIDTLGEAAIIAAHAQNWAAFSVLLSLDEEAQLLDAPAPRPQTEPFAVRMTLVFAQSLDASGVLPSAVDRTSGAWFEFFMGLRFIGPAALAAAAGDARVAMRAAVPLVYEFARAGPASRSLYRMLVLLPVSPVLQVTPTAALERVLNAHRLPCMPSELGAAALLAGAAGRPTLLAMAALAQTEPHAYLAPALLRVCRAHAASSPERAAEIEALVAAITDGVAHM